jgi:hypothetical protein
VSKSAVAISRLFFTGHLANDALGVDLKLCFNAFRDGNTGSQGGGIDIDNIIR